MTGSVDRVSAYFIEGAELHRDMVGRASDVVDAAKALAVCFQRKGKLLLCGNGGSAADSQHMAAELVSRLTSAFDRPGLPAIALTTDTSFLTAFANDVGFDGVFERQVRTLGSRGDALLAISASGTSRNVVKAVAAAKEVGLVTLGLTGEGGELESMVDHAVVIPSRDTQHVQEAMLAVEHILCHLVERAVFPNV